MGNGALIWKPGSRKIFMNGSRRGSRPSMRRCQSLGLLSAAALRNGRPLAVIDGLLAATPLEHTLTVVPRNYTDFTSPAAPILTPRQNYNRTPPPHPPPPQPK